MTIVSHTTEGCMTIVLGGFIFSHTTEGCMTIVLGGFIFVIFFLATNILASLAREPLNRPRRNLVTI